MLDIQRQNPKVKTTTEKPEGVIKQDYGSDTHEVKLIFKASLIQALVIIISKGPPGASRVTSAEPVVEGGIMNVNIS